MFMLRTHDLSWQDHVVNIEFMVNPSHNQLLFNKHKTLASKCDKVKRLYDKELKTSQKNFVVDMRMMERKKSALERRQSEIKTSKHSQEFTKKSSKPRSGNNNVPNTNIIRGQSAPPNIDSAFMTEVDQFDGEDNYSNVSPVSRAKTINAWYASTPDTSRPSTQKQSSSAYKSTTRQKSVRFDERITEDSCEPSIRRNVNNRVKIFLEEQKNFNKRPLIYNGRFKSTSSPAVAKRYTSTKLDTDTLMHAFNNLCLDNSVENFKKLSSMASRVKSNHKLARNTSLVPTVATLKTSRRFKEIIHKE
ncbi:unnamed protein product [Mytilus coruscus]|uniref:Uncharacterized protein n=1 Tax=Mytilus coruscus TaxID=42192 RepID=A0A6J8EU16_MYTCO|nr:unnamed protein product [Mytilus coruscus]